MQCNADGSLTVILLDLILLIRALKYSSSRRVRTLYCILLYTWLPRFVIALELLLGIAAFVLAWMEGGL